MRRENTYNNVCNCNTLCNNSKTWPIVDFFTLIITAKYDNELKKDSLCANLIEVIKLMTNPKSINFLSFYQKF